MTTIQLRDVEGAARRLMRAARIEIPDEVRDRCLGNLCKAGLPE